MKKILLTTICTCIFFVTLHSRVTKSEEPAENSSITGLQFKKITTNTNYRSDGSGDWLKPNIEYKFRTRNGTGGTVKVDFSRSKFHNCKVIAKSAYAPKSGEWSTNGIIIEALGEGAWNYSLSFDAELR